MILSFSLSPLLAVCTVFSRAVTWSNNFFAAFNWSSFIFFTLTSVLRLDSFNVLNSLIRRSRSEIVFFSFALVSSRSEFNFPFCETRKNIVISHPYYHLDPSSRQPKIYSPFEVSCQTNFKKFRNLWVILQHKNPCLPFFCKRSMRNQVNICWYLFLRIFKFSLQRF